MSISDDIIIFWYLLSTGFMNFMEMIFHAQYPINEPETSPAKNSKSKLLFETKIEINELFVNNK